jgi:hypothetical protein
MDLNRLKKGETPLYCGDCNPKENQKRESRQINLQTVKLR